MINQDNTFFFKFFVPKKI